MQLVLLLLSLIAFSTCQTQGTFGTAIALQANTLTTINFGLLGTPPSLIVQVDQNANITVNGYTALTGGVNYPPGFAALSLGVAVGFTISISPANAVVATLNLTTGALTVQSQAQIITGFRAGVLQFDSATNTFQDITVASYSPTLGLVVPLPAAGTYILVAANVNAALPTFYGKARQLAANVKSTLWFTAGLVLDVTAQANTAITVTYSQANPTPKDPPKYTPLNVYFDINLATQTTVASTLSYTYNATQLAAAKLNANQLQLGFYDTANAQWNFVGSKVDTNAMVVSTTTTHFSTWAVYAANSGTMASLSFFIVCLALVLPTNEEAQGCHSSRVGCINSPS
jgi:hypothetical protein